jgi:membrane protein
VIVAYGFPLYLSSISTIARFGTTLVFVIIVLGWFYVLALIILGGAIVNAIRLGMGSSAAGALAPAGAPAGAPVAERVSTERPAPPE